MQPLVLITYLALVLAVAGQAVYVQAEAPGEPEKLQVRDLPNRGDSSQDTALAGKKRIDEPAEAPAGSASGMVNYSARFDISI